MAFFPVFIELEGQSVLIVGGGRMAADKAQKLLGYGPYFTVIAPEICPALAKMPGMTLLWRAFAAGDIRDTYAFVIAATDDNAVNREVAKLCRMRHIPVNVVDTPAECSFFFPSLVRRGPLSIGISTSGASPAAAVRVKNEIEQALPDATESILLWLRSLCCHIRKNTQSEEQRKSLYQVLLTEALRLDRPLTGGETERLLFDILQGGEKILD